MNDGHVDVIDDLMDRIIDEQETQLASEHATVPLATPHRSFFTPPSGVRRPGLAV
ncbi:hypothetical protein [Kibdelosporangium phytohabitans]|uniref:hypothetical protein n=1 Tax=Kibdelosporangium phytohabitans TaxID=860235 RepID=UPI0012FC7C7A|nr:hypothetical protein [Kibdelosporangium phytohabitans]MBE1463474.1 hypothetical protein [Kibdelosporangium phytohabitans]